MIDNTFAYRELLGQTSASTFEAVMINVASPEVIQSWSHGEVKNPETINYRTFKPEKGGLFCERIFGPQKDWECNCGKYKRVKHRGIVCDRCGVEVTQSKVRRERMGHISLAVPVSHIWFFKCMPSRIGLMLDMTPRALERVIYYEDWAVTDPGDTPLKVGQPLPEIEYRQAREEYGDAFAADMGAPAIKKLLELVNLETLAVELQEQLTHTKNKTIRNKLTKRIRLVEGFRDSNSRPEWMIFEILPVIPPDLRPLVPLEGGRFASSDLNDLYRRVINRNNRLKNLLHLRTPEVIIRNEKRMLQEAVDALMDNGRHGRAVTGQGNRPLKSLSDMLKGKGGRFRQNLLGKRVDYSGRSVIVVGPELKIHQCGLPKKMALTLFEPFIIRHLKGKGYAHTVRGAKKMIEREEPIVWDILEEVTKGHSIMLNRAPTLHRLSIQAFDPVLIEGSAIRIHPLVCTAFNADFDGDQMAVHVPLSSEAQIEAKLLALSPNNIFAPSNGKPIASPTQDITLGAYYLTANPRRDVRPRPFKDVNEVLVALDIGVVRMDDPVIILNPDFMKDTPWGYSPPKTRKKMTPEDEEAMTRYRREARFITTTPGRCIFNEVWDSSLGFFNHIARKKELGKLISASYEHVGHEQTIKMLDNLKDLCYEYATRAGFSISITDLMVPPEKEEIIADARGKIAKIQSQYDKGQVTLRERHNKTIDTWTQASNTVANKLFVELEKNIVKDDDVNPVFAMLDSGARGSRDQIRQLGGMRGLMAKPSGDIIERPIISNFREGLTVLEYFISTHGARKGLADTALKTADSGYMTRKLVDVSQDIICREKDCGTVNGIWVNPIIAGNEEKLGIKLRIVGRISAAAVRDPVYDDGTLLVGANEEITPEIADKFADRGITAVHIRSVLTCETERGVCAKCYGRNLTNGEWAEIGDALGIIAAQSIGEPGTQLTMRTFHVGGTASSSYKQPTIVAKNAGTIRLEKVSSVVNDKGERIVINKHGVVYINDANGAELEQYELEMGATLLKGDGEKVKANEKFVVWDPYNVPFIAKESGSVEFHDLVEDVTYSKVARGGVTESVVMEHREDLHPQIVIKDDNGEVLDHDPLPAGAFIMIEDGAAVKAGDVLARIPRQTAKTKDITGGLPRVSELFEARSPKDVAEIARIDGLVEFGKMAKGKRQLLIRDPESGQVEEHLIPANKHAIVSRGERAHKGQSLTEGSVVPHELLAVCGSQELQRYIINEVQLVYLAQDVEINDKHIEIIVRQMMQKVIITEPGGSKYLVGEHVDRQDFAKENEMVVSRGGEPAEASPLLLGITKASLETDSFISAASFQDTTRILTEAATLGKIDYLRGFKENVITGHLIPAGTGTREMQDMRVVKLGEEIIEDFIAAVEANPAKVEDDELKEDIQSEVFPEDDFEPVYVEESEDGVEDEG